MKINYDNDIIVISISYSNIVESLINKNIYGFAVYKRLDFLNELDKHNYKNIGMFDFLKKDIKNDYCKYILYFQYKKINFVQEDLDCGLDYARTEKRLKELELFLLSSSIFGNFILDLGSIYILNSTGCYVRRKINNHCNVYKARQCKNNILSLTDIYKQRIIFKKLQYVYFEKDYKLNFSIDFLLKYFCEQDNYSRIIFLMICLESSIMYGIKDELSYKFATRTSFVLKKNLSKFCKMSYNIRSEIVHNGGLTDKSINNLQQYYNKNDDDNDDPIELFIFELENLTKDLLKYFIEELYSGKKLDKIMEDIDTSIIQTIVNS